MSMTKDKKITFFTLIDVLLYYKYYLLLSFIPPLLIYLFFSTKDVTHEYKYVLTVYPKDNPTSQQVVRSLENISKDNDILEIAEETSLLIYEDIVENSFRSSMLAEKSNEENQELIYSINNILNSDLGFEGKKIDALLGEDIKKLITTFKTENLFNTFTHRIDSESLLTGIINKDKDAPSLSISVEPLNGEKDYLKEYSVITNVEFTDEIIELIIDEITKQVLHDAFLKVQSIAIILQNRIDLKIEFLTQIRDSLVVKYVERANLDQERAHNKTKKIQFDRVKKKHDEISSKLINESLSKVKNEKINYDIKLIYLDTHLKMAESLNINSYRDIANEDFNGIFSMYYNMNADNGGDTNRNRMLGNNALGLENKKSNIPNEDPLIKMLKSEPSSFNQSVAYLDEFYYLHGTEFINKQIVQAKILHEYQSNYNKVELENLYIRLENESPEYISESSNTGEYDYYVTHFDMNIDLLKQLNFKDKIGNVLDENNISKDLELISYYNYIKLYESSSDNIKQFLLASFIASFILIYFILFLSHLYMMSKKKDETG